MRRCPHFWLITGRESGDVAQQQRHNKSLDASGGDVFLNLRGAALGVLIRAAASTQPLCANSQYRESNDLKGHVKLSEVLPELEKEIERALKSLRPIKQRSRR